MAISTGNINEMVLRELKNGEWNRKICMGPYFRSLNVAPDLENL